MNPGETLMTTFETMTLMNEMHEAYPGEHC